jgi:hypothetical protein
VSDSTGIQIFQLTQVANRPRNGSYQLVGIESPTTKT